MCGNLLQNLRILIVIRAPWGRKAMPQLFHCLNYFLTTSDRATCFSQLMYCSSMASLPIRPHCSNVWRIRCQADLNSNTTGTPPYYVDEDYPAGPEINEPLPEWSNWRGSESSTLETDVYVWRYALIVVHARNEWMNECEQQLLPSRMSAVDPRQYSITS